MSTPREEQSVTSTSEDALGVHLDDLAAPSARQHDPTSSRRRRRVGPFVYEPRKRAPRARGDHFPAKVAGAVGVAMTAVHEVVYRQTGGDDFTYEAISHAGVDMLFLTTLPVVAVLVLVGRRGR